MSCTEYDFLERAHDKAIEEANRMRLCGMGSGSVSSLDALVGAEVTKTMLDTALAKHLCNCKSCVSTRSLPPL